MAIVEVTKTGFSIKFLTTNHSKTENLRTLTTAKDNFNWKIFHSNVLFF